MENLRGIPHSLCFPLISLIILIFLVSQVAVILLPVPTYYWPFMDYPMYSKVRHENELVNENLELVGLTYDGQQRNIPPEELGLSFFKFNDWFVPRLRSNLHDPSIHHYVEQLKAMEYEVFRIQAKPVRISRFGITDEPIQVFIDINMHSLAGHE
ncbi:hypothetical protein [Nitrospira sp. M1]